MSGVAEAYSFMVFQREIPLNDYIQAIPEMTLFIHNVKYVPLTCVSCRDLIYDLFLAMCYPSTRKSV